MNEHPSYHQGLKTAIEDNKIHYCELCKKPFVDDGAWEGTLCDCLVAVNGSGSAHDREARRRENLRAVGDPRLNPSFSTISTKSKMLRTIQYSMSIHHSAFHVVHTCAVLYRLSALPLIPLGLISLNLWNPHVFGPFSLCIYIDLLRQEFFLQHGGPRILLNMVLEVCATVDSKPEGFFRRLFQEDKDFFPYFDMEMHILLTAVNRSFKKILTLYNAGEEGTLIDAVKNIGNSLGKFLTDPENKASLFLRTDQISEILNEDLPQTFIWIPAYEETQDEFVPPAYLYRSDRVVQDD